MNIVKMEKQLRKRIKHTFREAILDGNLYVCTKMIDAISCMDSGDYHGLACAVEEVDAEPLREVAE